MDKIQIKMAKVKKQIVKIIPDETITRKIYLLRDQKVMLDSDLADLYEVETGYLKRQVRRGITRFPEDFMFELTSAEYQSLRSQNGILNRGKHSKYLPFAFTEQGVGMLSGVVNSPKAVEMHIAIVRAFVEMRKLVHSNQKIAEQVKEIFEKIGDHDVQLAAIYDAIENLLDEKTEKNSWDDRQLIGFKK